MEDGRFVERDCLLFEAGAYPDKGVTVTAADLRAIARNSPPLLPVRIEHLAQSPFDGVLGVVTGLRVAGEELWGILRQPVEAWNFVQKSGSRGLSVGLDVAGQRLVEASFVCHPRVAKAQVFGASCGLTPRPPSLLRVASLAGKGERDRGRFKSFSPGDWGVRHDK